MSDILFLRLLQAEDKETALAEAVMAVRTGEAVKPPIYAVDPEAFGKVPGSPFAYWVSDRIRDLFQELPPFEGDGRTVKQGLATADDCRFVRACWEVAPERVVTGTAQTTPEEFRAQTFQGKKWVPFAKGGAYSPFYADVHLVVDWERDGADIKAFVDPQTGRLMSRPQNTGSYFLPGLTYPRRTTSGASFRPLPAGVIFADKGPAIFTSRPLEWLGLLQSRPFAALVSLQLGAADAAARSYEVGIIQRTPVPRDVHGLADLARKAVDARRRLEWGDETSHLFWLPILLQADGATLALRFENWTATARKLELTIQEAWQALDDQVAQLYGLTGEDLVVADTSGDPAEPADDEDEEDAVGKPGDLQGATFELLSYVVGCLFGRFDLRQALHRREPPLPDPFAPLPPCSPGMLLGRSGLPATPADGPDGYPIPIQWTGILPDDQGHPCDVVAQVRHVLAQFFSDAYAIEQEVCGILRVRDLRQFFANKFFPLHIRQYSRSHRKAPIYWLLQSSRKSYGLWFYYPRLNRDTLYVALRDYVEPKLAHEQDVLARLKAEYARARDGGERSARSLARKVEAQEDLIQEIAAFRDEIRAVADAGYDPDLDDGVLINIAPLHRLVPWKEAAACYKELKAGKYPWASMYKRYKFR